MDHAIFLIMIVENIYYIFSKRNFNQRSLHVDEVAIQKNYKVSITLEDQRYKIICSHIT